jgi:hypothetical protein
MGESHLTAASNGSAGIDEFQVTRVEVLLGFFDSLNTDRREYSCSLAKLF